MARWPKRIKAGTVSGAVTTSTDWYPTFLEAAGLPLMPAQHVDGTSLLPLFDGEGALKREAIFWHYPHYSNQGDTPASSVRAGDWKLIEWFEDGRVELYNLREDPGETKNLAAAKGDVVRDLHEKLRNWRKEVEGLIPKRNPNYIPPPSLPEGVDAAHV
jgi:arylsulfatase A-like enzyme